MAEFVLDIWKDKTPEELRSDCRRLSRGLAKWQRIAMYLYTPENVEKLPEPYRSDLQRIIDAYQDDLDA